MTADADLGGPLRPAAPPDLPADDTVQAPEPRRQPGPAAGAGGGSDPPWRRLAGWLTPTRSVLLCLWMLLAAAVLANSPRSFAVDTKPELYFAPWRSAAAYLSAWQANPQLGVPNFNVGLAPVAAAVGLIQALGVTPALSVRVLRLLLLGLGGWGASRLYRELRPNVERGDVGPLVAGVAFVANPYVVVAGATQAALLPWALLPWQLICLVRALREPAGWRSPRGWRWPAGFALTFFAMSGTNAGVVPLLQLLAVPVIVLLLRRPGRAAWSQALRGLARCAALVLVVSAYWLLPSVLAAGAGNLVVDNSETLGSIFGASSSAEVLRGLGLWPLYGSGAGGPWLPQYGGYLHNPVVVGLSFGLPVLAAAATLLTRGLVRRLGLALVAACVPIMVGLFPPSAPSPFGRLLRWVFEHVPAAGAFRTTNKIGAVLVLGIALLVAAGAVAVAQRTRGRLRLAATLGLVVTLAAGTAPAWTGRLYVSTVDLPAYWAAAAGDLNAGPKDERVWFVPGEAQSSYRWSQDRPDDLSTSVLSRPSLVRTVIPVTSPAAANLLAATDVQLNEGTLAPGALSATARYLGVGDLLLRNDVVWEDSAGGRPQLIQDEVNADAGLLPEGNHGAPGQNTISSRYPPTSSFEASLPPLQRYGVDRARPITRLEPASGTVLVDGDGFAVAPLVAAGLLAGNPPFRYLADLTPAELGSLLVDDVVGSGRIVLTDTNRRRTAVSGRLAGSQGPLLPAGEDPGPTRALSRPDAQTVLRVEGGRAAATQVGSAFGTLASAAAENAVDGDPGTAWRFGDFQHAVGQTLTIRTDGDRTVSSVRVKVSRTAGVSISRLRVAAGGASREADVDPSGIAEVGFDPPVRTDTVRVTVTATRGSGFNLVGIDEVEIPGVRLARVARLPETAARLVRGLDAGGRAALDRIPVDLVLTRVRGTGLPGDDEESGLARDLDLPVDRRYRVYGLIKPGTLSERDLDTLAGAGAGVSATSTSRAFDLPTLRASQAVDGDRSTAWVPGAPVVGQSLTLRAPARVIDHVDVTQLDPLGRRPADWATRVLVGVDGRTRVAALGPGTTRLPLAAGPASTLTLTILATRSGAPTGTVRLSEVDFGGARIGFDRRRAAAACVAVGVLDGQPLRMRPVQPVTGPGPAVWAGCARVPLAAGPHTVRPVPLWTADELVFRDPRGDTAGATGPAGGRPAAPPAEVRSGRGPAMTVRVRSADAPYYLVTGQAYDARWRATLDGRDLGPPVLVDGYSTGWRVTEPGPHTLRVEYRPQRVTDAALVASGLGVLGCLALLLRAPPPGPGPGGRRVGDQARRRWPWTGRTAAAGSVLAWAGVVALGWLAGGLLLATVALGVAGWHLVRSPAPGTVLLGGLAALLAVPVAWLAFRPDLGGLLSARLVQDNQWPHRLAAVGLLLLAIGVARAERAAAAPEGEAEG